MSLARSSDAIRKEGRVVALQHKVQIRQQNALKYVQVGGRFVEDAVKLKWLFAAVNTAVLGVANLEHILVDAHHRSGDLGVGRWDERTLHHQGLRGTQQLLGEVPGGQRTHAHEDLEADFLLISGGVEARDAVHARSKF